MITRGAEKGGPDMAVSVVGELWLSAAERVINPIVMLAHGLGIPLPDDVALETSGQAG